VIESRGAVLLNGYCGVEEGAVDTRKLWLGGGVVESRGAMA
jgi:hypothetical protein